MKKRSKYLIFAIVLIFIFSIGTLSANDLENVDVIEGVDVNNSQIDVSLENSGASDEITVENWDELQYYCSQGDKDYTLKLKENTNFYPTNPNDEGYQIIVNNNVTILGGDGSYFGDSSPNSRNINYIAILVPENSGNGIILKNITFKWISSSFQPNAIFLQMGGNANNLIENCHFRDISIEGGHSSVVHLMRGDATLIDCSFINVTSDFGCISIYDSKDDPTKTCTGARMNVLNSYFEGNYARTEPGCINNCGVLVVRNSTFYKNTAFWWAGAIHTHGGANTTIYDSNFTDNLAGWNGGALYTYSYLQIYNTIFVGNNCTTNNGGGAIGASKYLHAPYVYVKDSLFDSNENVCWSYTEESTSGLGRGGAISFMDEGSLTVLNTTFIKNSAAKGTAICAISQGSFYGSPDVYIIGNRFINHTRVGDVLVVNLDYDSIYEVSDNYYYNNSIEFSKLKLTADEKVGDEVTLHIDASLKNEKYYDSDILEKSAYDVYVDGRYFKTITGREFTLNLKNIEKCQVYVVPSISTSKSNEVSVGLPKEYIYVSQKYGNDGNDGLSRESPVATITKACEIARPYENIFIMDGTFMDCDITIDYNITIIGDDNVRFSSKGNVFNIVDGDASFKNLIFENIDGLSKTDRIIKHNGGILEIDNCTFKDNSINQLIESGGILEVNDLKFIENKGILINSNSFNIRSSLFANNIANESTVINTLITSKSVQNSIIDGSTFKNNIVKDGCVYYSLGTSKQYTLSVFNCDFINNTAKYSLSSQTFSSGIYAAGGLVDIKSSVFINNTDTGTYSSVIYTSTELHVSDSVFLGNSYQNSNKAIINSKASANLKKIYCDYNWWGNTQDNLTVAPQIHASSNCNNWLYLNVSTNATSLSKDQKVLINFNLNNMITKEGNVSYYDASNFNDIKFRILANGGFASDSEISLVHGVARTTYTLTTYNGNVTADYNGFKFVFNYKHSRIKPTMIVNVENISVGETAIVEIKFVEDVTGYLTIKDVETKIISGSETTFELNDLKSGEHVLDIMYLGDSHYEDLTQEARFNVDKYNSTTKISYGEINVGEDVVLSISLTDGTTGNVTLIINNESQTLNVTNSKAYYVIKSISRGNYDINAIYNGDWKYSSSTDNVKFGVGKVEPTINVNALEIVYGQDAVIEVILNTNATGNVRVSVDNKNKTEKLENGKATITISGLTAGLKELNVTYEGDGYYDSANYSTSFIVLKADTELKVNVSDIKIGASENIDIQVPKGVTGNVTIICEENTITKSINVLGKALWTLNDLPVGKYSVSATLVSDNYNSIQETAEFEVLDYLTPQWPNQGNNIKNSGKSPYESDSNGAIVWSYDLDGNVTDGMVIDSEGNIYVLASSGIYSINSNGNKLWNYSLGESFSGMAISRDVVIAPIAGNTLYFIDQTTGQRYGHSNIYQGSSFFAPVVDSNANVYISSEYQYASEDYKLVIVPYNLWENGGNPILISLGKSEPISAPVIIDENYLVVACKDSIKIIDLNKKEIYSSISGNTCGIRPVVGSGNIIYAVLNNNLQAMTPQGNVIWRSAITGGAGSQLALDDEIGLYLINSNGNLYKYDLIDGSESLLSNLSYTSRMLVGGDGIIYIGLNEMLYAFDSNGNLLWKSNMGESIIGTPVMDKNGVIYITTSNALKAISKADLIDSNIIVNIDDVSYGENANVVISNLDELTGFINVEVNSSDYGAVINGNKITISISNLNIGQYDAQINYSGDVRFKSKQLSFKFNVIGESQIIASDLTAYCGNKFTATLKDSQGKAIANENVTVTIANKKLTLTSDKSGKVSVDLNTAGTYQVTLAFDGNDYLLSSNRTSKVVVLTTIKSSETKKVYNSGEDFRATFLTNTGSPLKNKKVSFIVGTKSYNVNTDSKGIAVLNCKLPVGTNKITIVNPSTGQNTTQKAVITKRIINNKDLTMDYLDGSVYKVRVVGNNGKPVGSGQVVTFKINGKTSKIKTDKNGYAKLSIGLVPKTYTVTVEYKGDKVSNKIVVKQILKAKDVTSKKAKSYKFQATLKTSKGKAIVGKKITFKIKGKTYTAKTNKKGIATVTIKLNLNVGKYTISSTYSKTTIKNKITIKK